MISFVKGQVMLKDPPFIVIDTGPIGYKIFTSPNLLAAVKLGETVIIYTYTHVREDLLDLYGFKEASDLKLFENLISVSGVGPKTAIGIFAFGTRTEIIEAILSGDVEFFTRVPRLGRKNAQKIIIELKNKFGEGSDLDLSGQDDSSKDEILNALLSFGFSQKEAREALKNIDRKLPAEERIKQALKSLGK